MHISQFHFISRQKSLWDFYDLAVYTSYFAFSLVLSLLQGSSRNCWRYHAYIQNPLREKCSNTEFFPICIFLYSDQKILRIWKLLRRLIMTYAFSNLSWRCFWWVKRWVNFNKKVQINYCTSEHRFFDLCNKLKKVSASIFTTNIAFSLHNRRENSESNKTITSYENSITTLLKLIRLIDLLYDSLPMQFLQHGFIIGICRDYKYQH